MQWLLVKDGVQAFEMGHQGQFCCLESSGFLSIILPGASQWGPRSY